MIRSKVLCVVEVYILYDITENIPFRQFLRAIENHTSIGNPFTRA